MSRTGLDVRSDDWDKAKRYFQKQNQITTKDGFPPFHLGDDYPYFFIYLDGKVIALESHDIKDSEDFSGAWNEAYHGVLLDETAADSQRFVNVVVKLTQYQCENLILQPVRPPKKESQPDETEAAKATPKFSKGSSFGIGSFYWEKNNLLDLTTTDGQPMHYAAGRVKWDDSKTPYKGAIVTPNLGLDTINFISQLFEDSKYKSLAALPLEMLLKIMIAISKAFEKFTQGKLSRSGSTYIHGDVKPDNFVLTIDAKGNITAHLIDVATAMKHPLDKSITLYSNLIGTEGFVDPTITSSDGSRPPIRLSHRSDLYSLSKTLRSILDLASSHEQSAVQSTIKRHLTLFCTGSDHKRTPPQLSDLLGSLKDSLQEVSAPASKASHLQPPALGRARRKTVASSQPPSARTYLNGKAKHGSVRLDRLDGITLFPCRSGVKDKSSCRGMPGMLTGISEAGASTDSGGFQFG
jgi:serine/threonine protein kinase